MNENIDYEMLISTELATSTRPDKPQGYEEDLSDYGIVAFDGFNRLPIAWGFKILNRLGDSKFEALKSFGDVVCFYPEWALVINYFTTEMAVKIFGDKTNIDRGSRGGFKSITFGEMKFISKHFKNEKM